MSSKITPLRIKSISEFHRIHGLSQPEHPFVSIVDFSQVKEAIGETAFVKEFYSISLKRGVGKMFYGQQEYDFDEGVMYFMAPNQVLRVIPNNFNDYETRSGWMLLVHPDFLWNTSLAAKIKHYDFFGYSVNEALFLSEKEEATLNQIIQNIKNEYQANIDQFSQNIIIAHIETLLNYSERFHQRQFISRKVSNHRILDKMEALLNAYFHNNETALKGIPSVQFVAHSLNISPNYLSGLLKSITGLSTQQHIHEKLIAKAKERLSTTPLSINEIAYELGFEHSQSFSKLFKAKTALSPLEFRQLFN